MTSFYSTAVTRNIRSVFYSLVLTGLLVGCGNSGTDQLSTEPEKGAAQEQQNQNPAPQPESNTTASSTDLDTATDTAAGADTNIDTTTDTTTGADTDSDTVTEATAGAETDTDNVTETTAGADSDTDTVTETTAGPDTDTDTDMTTTDGSGSDAGTGSTDGSSMDTDIDTDADTDSSGSDTEAQSTDGAEPDTTSALSFNGGFDYGPMNDFAVDAAAQYTGVADTADINFESAAYISSVLHRPFAGRTPGKPDGVTWSDILEMPFVDNATTSISPPADGVYDCDRNSGTYTTRQSLRSANGKNYNVVSFDFDHCRDDSQRAYVNGIFEIASDASSANPEYQYLGFENVRVLVYAVGTVHVHGAVRMPTQHDCGVQKGTTKYLHLRHESGEELVLDNVTFAGIGVRSSWCGLASKTNWVKGDVLLSGHGSVAINTPVHLSHTLSHIGPSRVEQIARHPDTDRGYGGLLTVTGASGTTAEFTFSSIELRPVDGVYYQSYASPTVKLSVAGVDASSIEYDVFAFQDGVLAELADIDGDGMTDGWERAYGLNPDDGNDAALDEDADGINNLQEFNLLSDPTDKWSKGRHVDQQIMLVATERVNQNNGDVFLDLTLSSTVSTNIYESPAATVAIEFQGDAEWTDGCYAVSNTKVHCGLGRLRSNIVSSSYSYGDQSGITTYVNTEAYEFWDQALTLRVAGTSNVSVTAATILRTDTAHDKATPDPDMSNNSAVVEYLVTP